MKIDQAFLDALVVLRDSFLVSIKEQLRNDNWENFQQHKPVLGSFPDEETIYQCWDEFLEKVQIYIAVQPQSDMQANGYGPNMWWVYCYFGLMLHHFSGANLPWIEILKVIIIRLENATKSKVPSADASNFHYVTVSPNNAKNWVIDIDERAHFLYINIQDRLKKSKFPR